MLESIFSGITEGIASSLDTLVSALFSMLSFDMDKVLDYMPAIATFYDVFQWVALGLIAAIAVFQLGKFFFGSLSESKDSPVRILVRVAIASGMVYVGNYGLQLILDLFSYPMAALLGVDASMASDTFTGLSGISFSTGLGGILLALLVILALGWNMLKLLLEAIERWLMLCVLMYTSPLAYSTIASQATHAIFSKFFSMVIGQSILLLANVWSVKLILNIMSGINIAGAVTEVLFQCAVALAFSRIAQRIDSYLQQLGINSVTTGGSMLDTLAAVGGGLFSGAGGKGGVAGTVMGAWGSGMLDAVTSGNVVKSAVLGGIPRAVAGSVGHAVRTGATNAGMTAGEYVRSQAGKAANAVVNGAADAVEHFSQAGANGIRQVRDSVVNAATGGDKAREAAQEAGTKAARQAAFEGKSEQEARQAGLAAYDAALRETSSAGAMQSLTGKSMDARDAFERSLDDTIGEVKDAAGRSYIDSNGVVHNGFGQPQPDATSRSASTNAGSGMGTMAGGAGTAAAMAAAGAAAMSDSVGRTMNSADSAFNPLHNAGVDTINPNSSHNETSAHASGVNNTNGSADENAQALRDQLNNENAGIGLQDTNPFEEAMENQSNGNVMGADDSVGAAGENGTVVGAVGATADTDTSADAGTNVNTAPAADVSNTADTNVNDKNDNNNESSDIGPVPGNDPYAEEMANQNGRVMGAGTDIGSSNITNDAENGVYDESSENGITNDNERTIPNNNTATETSDPNQAVKASTDGTSTDGSQANKTSAKTTIKPEVSGFATTAAASGAAMGASALNANASAASASMGTGTTGAKSPTASSAANAAAPGANIPSAGSVTGVGIQGSKASTAGSSTGINKGVNGANASTMGSTMGANALGSNASTNGSVMGSSTVSKPAPTLQGPNAMVSRTIAASANSQAAKAGTGFSEYVKNPDPAPSSSSDAAASGYSAEVLSQGTKLAVNTINERGADVADDIIQSKYVVDNQAVAASALKNSLFMEGMDPDISSSFAAMDETGTVPAARDAVPDQGINAVSDHGSISDITVGKGVAEFTYEAPAQQVPVSAPSPSGSEVGSSLVPDSGSTVSTPISGSGPSPATTAGSVPAPVSTADSAPAAPVSNSGSDMASGGSVVPPSSASVSAESSTISGTQTSQPAQTFETVKAPVERVSVRTAEAFASMPAQEQALYKANKTDTGAIFYTKRVPVESQSFTVAPEHKVSEYGGKSSVPRGGYSSPVGSAKPGFNSPHSSGLGGSKGGMAGRNTSVNVGGASTNAGSRNGSSRNGGSRKRNSGRGGKRK